MAYQRADDQFVNPYHFVPLGDECVKSNSYRKTREATGLNTGWIECTLTTKSPIFIPNCTNDQALNNDEFSGKSYEFYSEDDLTGNTDDRTNNPPQQPAIPASELRGMIRSAYEAVTNACLSTTADDHILYKRTTVPAKPGPGILKKDSSGNWEVQPCKRLGLAAWNKYNIRPNHQDTHDFTNEIQNMLHGEPLNNISVSANAYTNRGGFSCFHFVTSLNGGTENGVLCIGEKFTRKHHESVFVEENSPAISVDERALHNLQENIKLYQDKTIKQMSGHNRYLHIPCDSIDLFNGLPIYYAEHNGRVYLSPAAIGREVFHNRLKDLIGTYTPCTKLDQLCHGCNLFGMTGKDEHNVSHSAVSRLSFTMGRFTKGPNNATAPSYLDPMIPAELASPKPSATEFYLKKPGNADIWNYDYAGSWGPGFNNLVEQNNYQPKIRGRKFYWHGNGSVQKQTGALSADRHIKIRPLNQGNTFNFKIHFNSITDAELKQLVWVLTIGQSGGHAHKIGMGKPVGLGSVQIAIDALKLRQLSLTEDTLKYDINQMEAVPCASNEEMQSMGGQKAVDAFLAITKLEHGYTIDYPRLTNAAESFKWFVGNKQVQGTGATGTKPKIDQPLPGIHNPELRKLTQS